MAVLASHRTNERCAQTTSILSIACSRHGRVHRPTCNHACPEQGPASQKEDRELFTASNQANHTTSSALNTTPTRAITLSLGVVGRNVALVESLLDNLEARHGYGRRGSHVQYAPATAPEESS